MRAVPLLENAFAAACTALAVCGSACAQAPADGGGVTFDFAKLSAGLFRDDAASPNLLDASRLKPNAPYIQGCRELPEGCAVRKAIAASGSVLRRKDGVWSIMTDPATVDRLCEGNRRAAENVVSCWSADVPVGRNPDGCTVRVSFRYRTHRAPGRGGLTWCILDDIQGPGTWKSTKLNATDSFWYPSVRDYKVAPGVEKFSVCLRLDGPGDFEFKEVAVRRVAPEEGKPPVEIFATPHGWLGRDFAVSSNQCAIVNYVWRRPDPAPGVKAEDYLFTFETAPGFDIVETFFGDGRTFRKTVRPDGTTVATVIAAHLPNRDFDRWMRLGLMVRSTAPVGTRGKARLSCACKGVRCSNVEELELFVIPEITARKPKRFANGFGYDSAYPFVPRSEEGRTRLADLIAACGVDFFYRSREMLPYLRARGVRHLLGGISAANGFQIGDGRNIPADERYVALNPKAHAGIDRAVCPASVYLEKPHFLTNTVPLLRRELAGFDGAVANWEPYYYARQGCMCDTCCREFANWAKRDPADVRSDWPACVDREHGRFGRRIAEFRCWQHGRLVRTLDKYVRRFSGGARSMGFIPEVEYGMMSSNWRETHLFDEVEVKDYAPALRWIDPWGPYSGVWDTATPFVPSPASWTADFFCARNVGRQAKADYPELKIIAYPQSFQCGTWVIEPEMIEMNVAAYFFNGWDASSLWAFPCGYDNRYWAALARASTLAADYEDFVRDGVRIDGKAVLTPGAGFPPPSDAVSNRHFPEYAHVSLLQHVAYELDGTRLVAVFNYRTDGPADFTLAFTDRPGSHRLSVPAARCAVFTFKAK